MKLLIVGSGGREHALAWKCAQSADAVFVTSANDAMNSDTITAINVPTDEATVQWAKDNAIDLIVIGGEEPLARGLADACQQNDLLCLGPTQDGARLESSKIWMKKLCARYHIPTAPWRVCDDEAAAHQCITQNSAMRVLKKDGLAAGKGVVVAHDEESALHHASHHFAHHDEPLLIEQRLDGRELSVFALLDGAIRCGWGQPKTTSAPMMAIKVTTPAAWERSLMMNWSATPCGHTFKSTLLTACCMPCKKKTLTTKACFLPA